ncbi:hypothetical protein IJ096_00375 [Candidatus Saccharibacteria bacterium]|nr:hypothetical protein [Candidatus Saccharibacteria bacterium]
MAAQEKLLDNFTNEELYKKIICDLSGVVAYSLLLCNGPKYVDDTEKELIRNRIIALGIDPGLVRDDDGLQATVRRITAETVAKMG